MKKSLKDIASLVSGEISGDPKIIIKGVSGIADAFEGALTFVTDQESAVLFNSSISAAAIVPIDLKKAPSKPHIKVHNVKLAMSKVLAVFENKRNIPSGTHKTAIISKSAKIAPGCSIMSNCFIGENVEIGNKTKIYPGCYIGDDSRIGKDSTLYPNVVLYERSMIGNNVVLHAGVIIGVDGFGYAPVNGSYEKIPQIGNVVIEDDVEICANSCVSRATMGSTVIKKGTKIDNLSHIAHNCKIGENCAITALVAVAGSSELGDHVSIGGMSGVSDHVKVGENSVIMARTGVTKDFPANSVVSGFPAQDHKKEMDQMASFRRLPKLLEKIAEIEKNIKKQ